MVSDKHSENIKLVDDFLFMKLGEILDRGNNKIDGKKTMQIYKEDIEKRGYSWFATNALNSGMSKKRVEYFNSKINMHGRVKILFAINDAEHDNDIAYSADVLEVSANKIPSKCPDEAHPDVLESVCTIWVKIANLKKENDISARMLKISSTGTDLKKAITNSQYHFGYVSYKE